MKNSVKAVSLALSASLLVGCSGVTGTVTSTLDSVIAQAKALVGIETEAESTDYVPPEGATQVTGMVVTAYGNEITLQLVADSASTGSGAQGGSGMTGEMPEGMTEGEMPEGMSEGGMSDRTELTGEGMTEGEMPEGMAEGEMSERTELTGEGMTEGEMPEGMAEGEMSERTEMTEGSMSERTEMAEGEAPEGMSEGGMSSRTEGSTEAGAAASTESTTATDSMPEMSGDAAMGEMSGEMSGDAAMGEMSGGMGGDSAMGGMSGGMDSGTSVDYSAIYTLSDETQLFVIPTGTIVEYYGFEMTFSQLEAEQYITITRSAEGNILYVEVLG